MGQALTLDELLHLILRDIHLAGAQRGGNFLRAQLPVVVVIELVEYSHQGVAGGRRRGGDLPMPLPDLRR